MPTTPVTGDTTARTVDDQFLDLICNDPGLLAAEFDAIITAAWLNPPADPSGRGAADGHPVGGAERWVTIRVGDVVCRPRHPGIGGWARQRSPPVHPADPGQTGRQVITGT